MRPVNLIPPEDRRGDRAPLRAGSLSYVLVGAFAAALLAVLGLVMTQNSITERENEIAELEVAHDNAAQQAGALAPYAEFATLQQQRELTITGLARSRFDWERVLRELARVIPSDVTLVALEAATDGESEGLVATESGGAPGMTMDGCARNHESVAGFVAALEDIDGVTRVGLSDTTRSGADGSAAKPGAAALKTVEGGACSKTSVATFSIQAVFDGATVALAPTPTAPVIAPGETNSVEEQTGEAAQAANLVPGVAR